MTATLAVGGESDAGAQRRRGECHQRDIAPSSVSGQGALADHQGPRREERAESHDCPAGRTAYRPRQIGQTGRLAQAVLPEWVEFADDAALPEAEAAVLLPTGLPSSEPTG